MPEKSSADELSLVREGLGFTKGLGLLDLACVSQLNLLICAPGPGEGMGVESGVSLSGVGVSGGTDAMFVLFCISVSRFVLNCSRFSVVFCFYFGTLFRTLFRLFVFVS